MMEERAAAAVAAAASSCRPLGSGAGPGPTGVVPVSAPAPGPGPAAKGSGGGGGGSPGPTAGPEPLSLPGILHFIQHEWARFEAEKARWEAERAELQVSAPRTPTPARPGPARPHPPPPPPPSWSNGRRDGRGGGRGPRPARSGSGAPSEWVPGGTGAPRGGRGPRGGRAGPRPAEGRGAGDQTRWQRPRGRADRPVAGPEGPGGLGRGCREEVPEGLGGGSRSSGCAGTPTPVRAGAGGRWGVGGRGGPAAGGSVRPGSGLSRERKSRSRGRGVFRGVWTEGTERWLCEDPGGHGGWEWGVWRGSRMMGRALLIGEKTWGALACVGKLSRSRALGSPCGRAGEQELQVGVWRGGGWPADGRGVRGGPWGALGWSGGQACASWRPGRLGRGR